MDQKLLIVAGVAGFLLLRQRAAAAQATVKRPIQPGATSYATPVDVAAAFARSLLSGGNGTKSATGLTNVNATGRPVWNDLSPAERATAVNSGLYTPGTGWVAPQGSYTAPQLSYSGGDPYTADVDSIPAAPVYDTTDEFRLNWWQAGLPG